MKSNIHVQFSAFCVTYIRFYITINLYMYLKSIKMFYTTNFLVLFCFQERNHTSVNGSIADFVSRAQTNLHVTSGNTRAKNRSNATSANGTLRDLTIWRCIWNATNRGATANLSLKKSRISRRIPVEINTRHRRAKCCKIVLSSNWLKTDLLDINKHTIIRISY